MNVGKLLGGILLVTGTTIGAGMLALPVSTGLAGFYPSLILFIFYWLYMTFTALLFLEINLWMGEKANLITMAKHTLGSFGEIVSWILYLFLLYSLTTAYLAGGGTLFNDFILSLTGVKLSCWMTPFPLLIVFGTAVAMGSKSVDYLNRVLMIGLCFAYFLLVTWTIPHVDTKLLSSTNWSYLPLAVSILATSFGFHIIIPTLTTYLGRDVFQLRLCILIGGLIPLFVYILWDYLALGVIPIEGESGILQGYIKGTSGAALLAEILGNSSIGIISRLFAFFAIVTSFLGVTLSLLDFLADGLAVKKKGLGLSLLCAITFIPPLLFSLTSPRVFLTALEYAGAFGVVILLAVLPCLMVWVGRYHKQFKGSYRAPGGKFALILSLGVSCVIIMIELANQLGYLAMVK